MRRGVAAAVLIAQDSVITQLSNRLQHSPPMSCVISCLKWDETSQNVTRPTSMPTVTPSRIQPLLDDTRVIATQTSATHKRTTRRSRIKRAKLTVTKRRRKLIRNFRRVRGAAADILVLHDIICFFALFMVCSATIYCSDDINIRINRLQF